MSNVGEGRRVGDQRHLTQNGQRTDRSNIHEPLGPSAAEEIFISEIDEVVSAERNRQQVSLLQVEWDYPGEIQRCDCEDIPRSGGNHLSGVSRIDCSGTTQERPAKTRLCPDLSHPPFP